MNLSATALAAFIIALLLAIGTMAPTGPWLVAVTVLVGVASLRPRWFRRDALAQAPFVIGLTAFIIALLLTTEAIERTDAWLVTLAVFTGLLTFLPRPPPKAGWRFRRRLRAWMGPGWDDDGDTW